LRLLDRHDLGYGAKEAAMKRQIVVYKAKPEHNAENERLLKGLFAELQTQQPAGLRYMAAKLPDDT
jgi:hypothetical protein